MLDIIFSLLIIGFFAAAIGYLHFCGKLADKKENGK